VEYIKWGWRGRLSRLVKDRLQELRATIAIGVADRDDGFKEVRVHGRALPNPQILRKRAARDAEQKND
jgi:hypothetical protein